MASEIQEFASQEKPWHGLEFGPNIDFFKVFNNILKEMDMNENADLNRFHDDGNPNHFDDLNEVDKRLQDEIEEFEDNEYGLWPDYSDGLY